MPVVFSCRVWIFYLILVEILLMKYLVTGAAGFIGFFATQRLVEQSHSVVGIDNLNGYYDVALKEARLAGAMM